MNQQEWLHEYQRSRYLREVDDDVLEQRLRDLASNLWCTDAAGNVVSVDPDTRLQLLRRIVDVKVEQFIRSGVPTLEFGEQALRKAAACRIPATSAQNAVQRLHRLFHQVWEARAHCADLRSGHHTNRSRELI